ncbi:MAG: hypothetical protein LBP63_01460 [Prevotellaceae bacterium]|jgi:uncharacterized membrane protein HdeD (DUF308 family)|nr:hypothetical protein [Prevotellaceae bacterium]
MKGFGIFLLIIGIMALLGSIANNTADLRKLFLYIGIIGGGIYLISRASKNEENKSEKDKWENS